MNLSQICAGVALLATVALTVLLLNRPPGPFVDVTVFVYAVILHGAAWVFTLLALRTPVGLPYPAAVLLHVIGGAIGLLGIFFVLSRDSEWWILPCVAFATVLPLLVHAAIFSAICRPALLAVFALQAASIVLVPAGYFARTIMKERANAAYNVNWSEELHERSNAIPSNAPIAQYFPFVAEPRHLGIAEHAARILAKRDDHEAMLVAALHGPNRYEALCLLAINGVPPTAGLASAVKDAIGAGAKNLNQGQRDRECKTAVEVAMRFEAFAPTLIPALQELRIAAGPQPTDHSFSGRNLLDKWLRKH